jgi:hypothetical protein
MFPVVNEGFSLSPYMSEWLAANRPSNQLSISSVCNCHCLFCSNQLNPFPIAGGTFRDIEDIKLQLCVMGASDGPISMSDSLPGRVSEGEALLHPRLFEILDLVRRKFFYNTLRFTTNGCLLDAAFVRKLAAYRPIEVTVSMHSTQPALWARIFAKGEKDARTAMAALPLLKQFGIELAGTIVPLPAICGWADLERTYEYLVTSGAKSMTLYWPGHSVRTPEAVVADLACPIEEFTAYAGRMKARFDVPQSPLPDMTSRLDVAVEAIAAKTRSGNPKNRGGAYRSVVWLASRAAFDRLAALVAEQRATSENTHRVAAADNLTYGGNIIAAGLLMVEDFVAAGRAALERWPETDLILVPTTGFDSLGRDLTGAPAYKIAESLRRPVWLVQDNGVVNAQLSYRVVSRRKPVSDGLAQAMDAATAARRDAGDGETVGTAPVSRRFEMLDAGHALCLETWPMKDGRRSLRRWTRLAQRESGWVVESAEEGLAD